jgi:isocitrate lyase
MAGKVLVSTQEHIDRLVAARLQADIMGTETILIARTDAEAATLLDGNVDSRDHPFILGSTNKDLKGLNDMLEEASKRGASQEEQVAIMAGWPAKAGLMTYGEAVERALVESKKADKGKLIESWKKEYPKLSNPAARALAKKMGVDPFWCWVCSRRSSSSWSLLVW